MKKYLLFSSIFEKILFYLLLSNRIDFYSTRSCTRGSNKEIDSVIWEWTKKQMEFLYFLVLLLVLLLVLCVTRHLAPNPTARATHAWNQACNTKWLVRLLGPRVGRRDAEDKTNSTRTPPRPLHLNLKPTRKSHPAKTSPHERKTAASRPSRLFDGRSCLTMLGLVWV